MTPEEYKKFMELQKKIQGGFFDLPINGNPAIDAFVKKSIQGMYGDLGGGIWLPAHYAMSQESKYVKASALQDIKETCASEGLTIDKLMKAKEFLEGRRSSGIPDVDRAGRQFECYCEAILQGKKNN